MKTCKAGCVLFHKWKCTIYCDETRESKVKIMFGNKTEKMVESDENISKQMSMLAQFFEDCLKDWTLFCSNMRRAFEMLNYLMMTQIVILCKELAVAHTSDTIPPAVLHIIQAVNCNGTERDLLRLLRASCKSVTKSLGLPMNITADRWLFIFEIIRLPFKYVIHVYACKL